MRRHFQHPLARRGFTVLAIVAALNGLWPPAVACTLLAAYAWHNRRR
ncbi:hypothetical protein [Streptomyces sp. F-1]|nr:hypothetical protein [Streptomyces sp. F-1]SFY52074.1 hypothetical protein STEPF1_05343 [Streptomyces sp. F-1]